jgi:hypothetical protein
LPQSSEETTQQEEWWKSTILESPLGVLVAVKTSVSCSANDGDATAAAKKPSITEMLFYAAKKDLQLDAATHPHSSISNVAELGLFALPLSSDLLLLHHAPSSPPSPITTIAKTEAEKMTTGEFLPFSWDTPTTAQKRKSALESTFTAASELRRGMSRRGRVGVEAGVSTLPSLLPRLKSEGSVSSFASAAAAAARERSTSPSLRGYNSQSGEVAGRRVSSTLRRVVTPLSTPSTTTTVTDKKTAMSVTKSTSSSSSTKTTTATTTKTMPERALQEKKNKELISKVVLAGLRLWGYSNTASLSNTTTTSTDKSLFNKEKEREKEEYKLLYHHTYKSTCFALRHFISTNNDTLESDGIGIGTGGGGHGNGDGNKGKMFIDIVRETVDALLGIFVSSSSSSVGGDVVSGGVVSGGDGGEG